MDAHSKSLKKASRNAVIKTSNKKAKQFLRVSLKKANKMNIDGESVYFHNETTIQSWLNDPKVDVTVKVFFIILNLYTLEKNKEIDPSERIRIQNTKLMEMSNVTSRSTVQKALRYLTKMGIIEDRIFISKGDKHSLKEGVMGLTNRRIVLNLSRAKVYLRAIPGDNFFEETAPRSRERRLIYRRPLSLVEYLNNRSTETQVNDINRKKNRHQFDKYLEKQLDTYNNFVVSDVEEIISEHDNSGNYIDALYKLITGDLIPPELMSKAS